MAELPKKVKFLKDETIDIEQVKPFLKGNDKPVLIVGIGTPKVLLDSVGPYVATALQVSGFNVRGTMGLPVHALNIRKFTKSINLEDYFVIAIDACIGTSVGAITITNGAIHPGAAANKMLPAIGNMAIKLVVATKDDFDWGASELVNKALTSDPNNIRDLFKGKIVNMFKQLRKEGLL